MQNKGNIMETGAYISPDLLNLIQSAINGNWISVFIDPSGQMREYSLTLSGGVMLTLTWECFDGINEYTIEIDDEIVAMTAIPQSSKVHTPDEQTILRLFSLCSTRVIAQEIQSRFIAQGPKTYS